MSEPPGDERPGTPEPGPGGSASAPTETASETASDTTPPVDADRRAFSAWLWRIPVLLAAGAGSWAIYQAIDVHFGKRRPDATPDWQAGDTVPVAPLRAFDAEWAATEFVYGSVPAVAARLPGAIPGGLEVDGLHLAAFSRICTHMGCVVSLNRDTEAIAFAFNYRAPGPQLVCRCHLSVFDPDRAGRAVAGPAVEPLPRVRLERDGDEIVATGVEPAPAFTGIGS